MRTCGTGCTKPQRPAKTFARRSRRLRHHDEARSSWRCSISMTIQSYRHNPTVYVELIGNALFNPLVLEYAPKPERMRDIIARTQKIPAFLDQAKANLTDSPDIWTNGGQPRRTREISTCWSTPSRRQVPPELRADFDRAAKTRSHGAARVSGLFEERSREAEPGGLAAGPRKLPSANSVTRSPPTSARNRCSATRKRI